MTSHPKDLSDELIEVMAESQKDLSASSSASAVRQQPGVKRDEPSVYKRVLSGTG